MTCDPVAKLDDEDRRCLLQVAGDAIWHELCQYVAMEINSDDFSPNLRALVATFVTLQIEGKLRGCIGSLEAHRPLVIDVARNAGAAAFADPRFPRLARDEFERIDIHISILSSPEPVEFESEADLLTRIRPQVDGLILTELTHRGTFLPDVWQQVAEPRQFLENLKNKAGLPADYWSDTIQIQRYTTESIP